MEPETRDMSWECGGGEVELRGLLSPVSPLISEGPFLSPVEAQTNKQPSQNPGMQCVVLCSPPPSLTLSQNDVMHTKICNDVLLLERQL